MVTLKWKERAEERHRSNLVSYGALVTIRK